MLTNLQKRETRQRSQKNHPRLENSIKYAKSRNGLHENISEEKATRKKVHLKSPIARAKETKMFYKIRIKKREFKKGIYKKRFCCFHNGKHRGFFTKDQLDDLWGLCKMS